VLDAQDPWDAYKAGYECIEVVDEHLNSLPMSEPIWISWMWAVDVFELDDATPAAAQGVLRRMASEWVRRPTDGRGVHPSLCRGQHGRDRRSEQREVGRPVRTCREW
jgi:hypothetical protein